MKSEIRIRWFLLVLIPQIILGTNTDTVLTLNEAVAIALEENPQLNAVSFRTEAAKANVVRSGSLPDPKLTFGLMNLPMDTYKFNQEPMTQKSLGLAQSFPFFGKRGLRQEIARAELNISADQMQQMRLSLISQVKGTYFHLYFLRRSMEIVEKNRILLQDLVEISRTRYTVGKGIQQDILNGQVQLLREEQRLIELEQEYQNTLADLNIMLNRLPQSPLRITEELPFRLISSELNRLQDSAIQNSPHLNMARTGQAISDLQVNLARRDYWPDFMLSVTYGQREARPDFLGAMVSVNIPLYFGSNQSRFVEESRNLAQNSRYLFEDQKNNILKKVKNLVDELEKNKKLIGLYENEIIPYAGQALNSSVAAYQNDQVDFLTLISNQMALLDHQLNLERLKQSYRQNVADLEMICGINL